ncbi:MAG: type 4a pilus biogenesis protein PilO [Thermodesulfobacteriota bacterium]
MKLPLEKLEKVKTTYKVGILVLVVGLLGAGFYFLLYQGLTNQAAKLKGDIKAVEKKISEHRSKVKDIPIIKKELEVIGRQVEFLSQYIPQQKEVDQLLKTISESGSDAGLIVTLFKPNLKETIKDFYAEIGFDMKFEGPYFNVAQFFYQTAKMERIVNIENITMEKPTLVDNEMILTTSCTGKTFRFLTEAEIKAREEAKAAAMKKKAAPTKKVEGNE